MVMCTESGGSPARLDMKSTSDTGGKRSTPCDTLFNGPGGSWIPSFSKDECKLPEDVLYKAQIWIILL